jgi:Lsr2
MPTRPGGGGAARPGPAAASRQRSEGIRAWANQAGIAVSARGHIPASVIEQYQATTKRHRHPPRSRPGQPRAAHPWPPRPANGIRPGRPTATGAQPEADARICREEFVPASNGNPDLSGQVLALMSAQRMTANHP